MGEKVYQFCEKLNKGKRWRFLYIVLYIVLVILFSVFEVKNHAFYYPEEEYQILEEEAWKLVQESGAGLEFETDYRCIIDYYNMQSNEVIFRLIDSEYKLYRLYDSDNKYIQPTPLYIKVNVENWKTTNREIRWIERMNNSKATHIVKELVAIIILPICITAIFWTIMMFISDSYSIIYKRKALKRKSKSSLDNET